VAGLDAIRRMWDEERESPDEVFTLTTDGRCDWFEEWPFWPKQPLAAPADPSSATPRTTT